METTKKNKTLRDYSRLIRDVKQSGSMAKIFETINSIERLNQPYNLLATKHHLAASLYALPVVPSTNIFGELTWGSIVLQRGREDIKKYLALKRAVELLVLQARWNDALSLLTEFELEHGTAAVIKKLSIAITQQAEGTARQVAYSRKLEARCRNGAFLYIVRFTSERNEDRLPLSGFRRHFREFFSPTKIEAFASAVIHWHGMHQLPDDEYLIAQVLGFEGGGSIFDYFEAFVAVATHLASRGNLKVRTALKNSLQRVSDIGDQRLINLRRLLAGEYANPSMPLTATNVLLNIRARSSSGGDLYPLEKVIFDLLSEEHPEQNVRRNTHKLAANFYYLDFFQALFCHLEHKVSVACLDQAVAPGLSVLASDVSIRSAFAYSYEVAQELFSNNGLCTKNVSSGRPLIPPIDNNADALLFKAIGLAKKNEAQKLIKLTNESDLCGIEKSHLQLITIACCYEASRYVDILPLALDVSEVRLDALSLVPIVKALENILPGRLCGRNAVLFSIVTSRVLLVEDSDRLEDKLMVAVEVAFADWESTPAWIQSDQFNKQLWIRFLCDVLTVQNMLLIDDVNSLSDALNLRLEVLRKLVDLDSDNRDKYHEEVRDITFSLSVDEGIRQVNTSRLNVNINGLSKWANDHCADDYERYKELIIGEASAGNMPTKIIGGSGNILDQFAAIPLGVADDQLIKLLVRIRSAYLSDPRNGLDAFISLRVRHGSLSGTLSRGLDIRQLLLLRKGEEGPFESPIYWIDKFNLSDSQATEVTRAFATFTRDFRESIDGLLKNRLRVKSERNLQGEITAEITDFFAKGLKIDIVQGMSFDSFISNVFLYYKNAVSAYLESVREYLKSDFLTSSIEALERLSMEVGMVVNNSEKKGVFDDAITNARLDLRASIRVVCGWLEIAQKEDLAQLYTLNQATEIGINYTRQVRNDFVPNIRVAGVDDSFRITGVSLIVIVDILFILLDNVYKHAGSPNDRSISLTFDLSEENLIKIKMRNDLAESTDRGKIVADFDVARKLIAGSEGEKKLTEEDRSGLPKLSRLVVQDRSNALSFGLENSEVEVNVFVGYSTLELSA